MKCSLLRLAEQDDIRLEDNLFDKGLDSIQGIQLIVALEEAFHMEFMDEDYDLEKFRTLARITELVAERMHSFP
nr:acyl carrier protein [Paenibacillus massiliensis]